MFELLLYTSILKNEFVAEKDYAIEYALIFSHSFVWEIDISPWL